MIGNDWDLYLKDEYEKDYFKNLIKFIDNEYKVFGFTNTTKKDFLCGKRY